MSEAIARASELFEEQPGTVKAWYYGERFPQRKKVPKIIARTDGKVKFTGIYGDRT